MAEKHLVLVLGTGALLLAMLGCDSETAVPSTPAQPGTTAPTDVTSPAPPGGEGTLGIEGMVLKGGYNDFAPSGTPDFDQNQAQWTNYSCPAAAANSLWWFDSRFETVPAWPPHTGQAGAMVNDNHPLVQSYGDWDDHDPANAPILVDDLAWFLDTNGVRTGAARRGTLPGGLAVGIDRYLIWHGLRDQYAVRPPPSIGS